MFEADWTTRQAAAVIGSVALLATVPGGFLLAAHAQTLYPDVSEDYWAQPFIAELTEANILTGYPDGTFRPDQAIDRDEYAAVIRQAFDADAIRTLPNGSAFSDVPEGYWADDAIEEAYETGFLGTPDPNEFEPQTEISRADAIVALVEGLGLSTKTKTAAVPVAAEPVQPVRQKRRQPPNRFMFPMASTAMMQLFAPPARAAAPNPPAAQANGTNPEAAAETSLDLSQYYADADQIPDYARDEVAIATQAGLIVNYPELSLLNPNAPISRGGTAALVHRALVYQNEIEPVEEAETKAYIVEP